MKLYIDMIAFYLQRAGGITVLWKKLIVRMIKEEWNIILVLQNSYCDNIYFEKIMLQNPKIIYEIGSSVKRKRYRAVNCSMEENSLFVSTYYRTTNNTNIKQFTIVHDFTYEYYSRGIRKAVHLYQKKKSIKDADMIICVSQNTKKDLLTFYPWTVGKKIHVVHNGVSDVFRPIDEIKSSNPFFVFVGSRAKYKRFDMAIDIAAYYGYCLVIVGGGKLSTSEKCELEHKLKNRYILKLGITETELNQIYNKAVALLYPSEYEGFGIPIIEAQKAGCPVVARSGTSINEVVLNDDLLMNCSTLPEAQRIIDMLKDEGKRKQVIEQGYSNALRFSWDSTYEEYRKLMESSGD